MKLLSKGSTEAESPGLNTASCKLLERKADKPRPPKHPKWPLSQKIQGLKAMMFGISEVHVVVFQIRDTGGRPVLGTEEQKRQSGGCWHRRSIPGFRSPFFSFTSLRLTRNNDRSL